MFMKIQLKCDFFGWIPISLNLQMIRKLVIAKLLQKKKALKIIQICKKFRKTEVKDLINFIPLKEKTCLSKIYKKFIIRNTGT